MQLKLHISMYFHFGAWLTVTKCQELTVVRNHTGVNELVAKLCELYKVVSVCC